MLAGFNVVTTYREHSSDVRSVVYNSDRRAFVSTDDFAMRLWHVTERGNVATRTLQALPYPPGRIRFVTSLMYSPQAQLYFCACMDGRLRLYKHNLRIKACLEWPERAVYAMRFVNSRDELVVAGASGAKVLLLCLHYFCLPMVLQALTHSVSLVGVRAGSLCDIA